ncbi:MAG: hypothetical protein WA960_02205 [Tunicatimonas sp.]
MKTERYNPSPLEQELARAIEATRDTLSKHLTGTLVSVETLLETDNPKLKLLIQDDDGDQHTLVVQIIQRIDQEVD